MREKHTKRGGASKAEIRQQVVRQLSAPSTLWGLITKWQDRKRCIGFLPFLPIFPHIISRYLAITLLLHYYVTLPPLLFPLAFGCVGARCGLVVQTIQTSLNCFYLKLADLSVGCKLMSVLMILPCHLTGVPISTRANKSRYPSFHVGTCIKCILPILKWRWGPRVCCPPQPEETKDLYFIALINHWQAVLVLHSRFHC